MHRVYTAEEAKEVLRQLSEAEEDIGEHVIIQDEIAVPKAAPEAKNACESCGKEMDADWPMRVCASCAPRLYGASSPQVPDYLTEEFAKIENGKVKSVHVQQPRGNGFKRKVVAGALVFLLVCAGLSGLAMFLNSVPNGNGTPNDWDTSGGWFAVNAWMVETEDPETRVTCAMALYGYQNESWVLLEEHPHGNPLDYHSFNTQIPLGAYAAVRGSVQWGTWSHPATLSNGITLSQADGYEVIELRWQQYTIFLEAVGYLS